MIYACYIISDTSSDPHDRTLRPPDPAPPSLLDEHRTSPGLLLALLGQEAMHRLRAAHTAHNLKPRQFQILGLLHDHGGLAQRDLVQTMAWPRASSSRCSTRSKPTDSSAASATPPTAAATWSPSPPPARQLASARARRRTTEDALFASLDNDQREQLRALLLALSDGLAADPEAACTAAEERRR